jgi:hypothetical protein
LVWERSLGVVPFLDQPEVPIVWEKARPYGGTPVSRRCLSCADRARDRLGGGPLLIPAAVRR